MLTQEVRSARPRKEQSTGHAVRLPRPGAGPAQRSRLRRPAGSGRRRRRGRSHPGGGIDPARVRWRARGADGVQVRIPPVADRAWRSPLPLAFGVALTLLFATGVGPRPDGAGWDLAYDVVLYSGVGLAAVLVCLQAALRSPVERLAHLALAAAFALNAAADLLYSLVVAGQDPEPSPSIADAFYLAFYVPLYIALVGLIRSRVRRFHTSMWLDGLIGALGAGAVAVALVLSPALASAQGGDLATLTTLAYPVADVVLLALLVAVGAILGVRRDRVVLLIAGGLATYLVGDVGYLHLTLSDSYVTGGPLDLTWLVGTCLIAASAHAGRPGPGPAAPAEQGRSRVGWRVLAVPLVCNLASLVVLGVGWGDQVSAVAAWCAIGCVLAALARTAVTFAEVRTFHEVRREARTDELTGLANRRSLLEAAGRVVADADSRHPAALLLMDLDGFKEVNDGLGHHAGDELLRQIGPRVTPLLGERDVLARLGGDEFAVLLPGTGLDAAQLRAEQIRDAIGAPFRVDGIRLHVGVSIGVATAPVPAASVEEMLRCADVAMYAAKKNQDGVSTYISDPGQDSGDRLRTMEELRVALHTGQLLVHLQPQIDLAGGSVAGVEALVRWQHPARGLLSPAHLLPAATQAGLLRPLMTTVLELSLAAAARWWPTTPVPVSVNLSAADVTDLDLPDKVMQALARHGLPPGALTLELVEDTLMSDPDRGRQVLAELRQRGVRTSIDDYGTGYSSLAYLHTLPADELKLDRSLTRDVATDPRARAIVAHTVALTHELGLVVVAEGVEDLATGEVLRTLGCDLVQGFAYAVPVPVEEFVADLLDRAPDPVRRRGVPVHPG